MPQPVSNSPIKASLRLRAQLRLTSGQSGSPLGADPSQGGPAPAGAVRLPAVVILAADADDSGLSFVMCCRRAATAAAGGPHGVAE